MSRLSPLLSLVLIVPGALALAPAARAGEPVQQLSPVVVAGQPPPAETVSGRAFTERITSTRLAETINAVDAGDALKYSPSLFLRKRNNGDTQATLATRVWGVSSSARSLVYANGVPLSALIANNNTLGGPRWGLLAPAEIERIDVMYGPFSAAYPGNSMGAVVEIVTRQPEKFEAHVAQTLAWQRFDLYGTHRTFATRQTAANAGAQQGKLAFFANVNFQESESQPIGYVMAATFPAGTVGAYASRNKLGQSVAVLGATGLLHTRAATAKLKLGYDFSRALRASYTLGLWRYSAGGTAQTFLRDANGAPTFAGLAAFANGESAQRALHMAQSLSLKSAVGHWRLQAIATLFRMERDEQRLPAGVAADGIAFSNAGRMAVLGGTGWSTLDLKAAWHPAPRPHAVSFGAHDDRYTLHNPTFTTAEWRGGPIDGLATEGSGKTRTQALWAQDVWQLGRKLTFTAGLRYEVWRAYDGINVNGATVVHQPGVRAARFSPKATLAWRLDPQWTATLSVGQAYRFATVGELYQLVSTGTTFTAPNPDLKPDDVLATELRIERRLPAGHARLAVFQDDVHDAILTQFNPLLPGSPQLFSFPANLEHIRAQGVELAWQQNNVFARGLELNASVTYVDARTLALRGRASATAPAAAAIGRRLPNIPEWRAAVALTWRPTPRWSITTAGRYSGMMFTTLDNTDANPNTWQGFGAWFVADARVHCRIDDRWSAALGADNLFNRKYFLFHPFPQRTIVTDVTFTF